MSFRQAATEIYHIVQVQLIHRESEYDCCVDFTSQHFQQFQTTMVLIIRQEYFCILRVDGIKEKTKCCGPTSIPMHK